MAPAPTNLICVSISTPNHTFPPFDCIAALRVLTLRINTSHAHVHTLTGPFVSLGRPVEELGGVQVFAGPGDKSNDQILPALMVHIPASANPLGNFDRWAVFATLARTKESIGQASHEQVIETTASSNGTKWRYVVDHGTKQIWKHRKGLSSQRFPQESIVLPLRAPRCVPGHDTTVNVMGTYVACLFVD